MNKTNGITIKNKKRDFGHCHLLFLKAKKIKRHCLAIFSEAVPFFNRDTKNDISQKPCQSSRFPILFLQDPAQA